MRGGGGTGEKRCTPGRLRLERHADGQSMTTPIQIVIDTNVIVAAFRSVRGASYALLQSLGDSRWQLNLSTALVLEYESEIKREFRRQGRSLALAEEAVDGLLRAANRQNITRLHRPLLPDPGDEFVLELAIESGASYVVTYNLRHFKGVEDYGVRAIRPAEFLRILEGRT
jgi:predicted nucleic acid-binding protein